MTWMQWLHFISGDHEMLLLPIVRVFSIVFSPVCLELTAKKDQVLRCSIKIYWKQSFGSETCKWKLLIWKFQEIHKSTSAEKKKICSLPIFAPVIYLFYVYLGHRCSNLPLTFWGPQTCHQITPCDCFTSHLSMWGTFHESSWLVNRDHYVVGYYNLHITG